MQRIRQLIIEAHRRSLWQVLGVYVFGAWAVYQIIAEVTDRLGMPEWVPGVAIVLFLIGLPVVLATAFVQEGPPSMGAQGRSGGIDPTLFPDMHAAEAGPAPQRPQTVLTWQRSVLAGITAFLLLGITAGGYMGLREAGVGPFASLLSGGELEEMDRLIIAQFTHAAGDTITADAVTEALRVDLAQSRVLMILQQGYVADALQRMDRPRDTRLEPDLAREVAIREGAKALLTGDVTPAGSGHIITVRLLHAGTGEVLLSRRETADGDDDIIRAIDRLSKKLRADIGESLRTVRADPRLDAVTTRSLPALRKYAQATRLLDLDLNFDRGIPLLREAVEADSMFAMAWLKLAASYFNIGAGRDLMVHASTRAYDLRDRLTERERYHMIALHNLNVTGDDAAAAAAYEALLELDPNDAMAMHRLAIVHSRLRDHVRSAELYRRALAVDSLVANRWTNLAMVEYALGNRAEAARLVDEAARRFPQAPTSGMRALVAHAAGDYATAERVILQLLEEQRRSATRRAALSEGMSHLRRMQGRAKEARTYIAESAAANRERGVRDPELRLESWLADLEGTFYERPEAAVRRLDAMTASSEWESLAPENRDQLWTAIQYARYGNVARARELRDEWLAVPADRRPLDQLTRTAAEGWIALAEGRAADAIPHFRKATGLGECVICAIPYLAMAYENAGVPDSAIAYYRRYLETPQLIRISTDGLERPSALERLARLYAERGDAENAARYAGMFVELWKDADPELKPRVQRVQQLISREQPR